MQVISATLPDHCSTSQPSCQPPSHPATHSPALPTPDHEPAVAAGLWHAPHRAANLLPLLATLAHQLQQLGVLLGGPLALQASGQAQK